MEMAMRFGWVVAMGLAGIGAAPPDPATETTIEQMPARLETRFARRE
jgi:hypothetical protein